MCDSQSARMINTLRIYEELNWAMEPKAAPEGGAVSATDPDSPSGDSNAHGGDLLADAVYRLANQAYVNLPALLA